MKTNNINKGGFMKARNVNYLPLIALLLSTVATFSPLSALPYRQAARPAAQAAKGLVLTSPAWASFLAGYHYGKKDPVSLATYTYKQSETTGNAALGGLATLMGYQIAFDGALAAIGSSPRAIQINGSLAATGAITAGLGTAYILYNLGYKTGLKAKSKENTVYNLGYNAGFKAKKEDVTKQTPKALRQAPVKVQPMPMATRPLQKNR